MKTAVQSNSNFDLPRIERETFVRQLVFRQTLRSTNDLALQLARSGEVQLPLLVLAEHQTDGRGRGDNRWWSAGGSLTFSVLLDAVRLGVRPECWPQISLSAATAVCEAIDDICLSGGCGIRWPNDVYLAGRKVCGILPELVPDQESNPIRLVLGIGININNTFAQAPLDVRARGASLADLAGRQYDTTEVLVRVLNRLDDRLGQLTRRDPRLASAWSSRCLLRSRTVELALGERRVRGLCHGVDRAGALLLSTGTKTERFVGGVISGVDL